MDKTTKPSRRRRGRPSRRARAHAEALLNPTQHAPTPDHPLIPRQEPVWLTTTAQLIDWLDSARDAGAIAYDTEFIGESSYHPRLCLVQLATSSDLALVDPLTVEDLTPLWRMIADPQVLTLVHAGAQDVEPVTRHLGLPAANVFDVQIAAGFAGQPYPVSLLHLVQAYAGVNLGKGLTFTNWEHRPLSATHQRYAADDVRYLPLIHHRLSEALEQSGSTAWALAACNEAYDAANFRLTPREQALRIAGNLKLSRKELAVLLALSEWRDAAARDADLPPRSLLKDELLLGMARRPPRSSAEFGRFRHLPRPVVQRHGQMLLDLMADALAQPPADLPVQDSFDEKAQQRNHADALWAAVGAYCHGRGIDPALLTTRGEIIRLRYDFCQGQSLEAHPVMRGWRGEVLGEFLTAFLQGQTPITLRYREGQLVSE